MKNFMAFIGFCCLGLIGLFGFLIVVGSQKTSSSSTDSTEATSSSPLHEISHVTVGDFTYPVTTVSNVTVAVMAAQAMPAVFNTYEMMRPDGGKFAVIRVSIANHQRDEITMSQSLFKLVASDGTEYSPSEKSLELPGDQDLFLKGINPGLTKTGVILFEVPTDTDVNRLGLVFRGGMTGDEAFLPLNEVGVRTPESLTPAPTSAVVDPPPDTQSKPYPAEPEATTEPEPTTPAPIVREPPPTTAPVPPQ